MGIEKATSGCIYCGGTEAPSTDHVLPRYLGTFRGMPTLVDRICRACNQRIGQSEEQFCRSGPEAFFRQYLGIAGRKGHTAANPFEKGSAGGRPIDFVAPHPERGIPVLWEFNPGGGTVREVCQVVVADESGSFHQIRLPPSMTDAEQLRAELSSRHLRGLSSMHVFAHNAERERIETLLKDLTAKVTWLPDPTDSAIQRPIATVTVTDAYFRAVAKVAFHCLLVTATRVHGHEEEFGAIRRFILHGGPVDNFVSENRDPIVAIPPGTRVRVWGHLLLVEEHTDGVKAKLRFFLGPSHSPRTFCVRLARTRLSIGGGGWYGHHCVYRPHRLADGHVGVAEVLRRRDPGGMGIAPIPQT